MSFVVLAAVSLANEPPEVATPALGAPSFDPSRERLLRQLIAVTHVAAAITAVLVARESFGYVPTLAS